MKRGGYLVNPFDDNTMAIRIATLIKDKRHFGLYNSIKARMFDVSIINQRMSEIYLATAYNDRKCLR